MTPETRAYPASCLSWSCGRAECSGCPFLPALEAFKAWVADTSARVEDPVWAPTVYTSTTTPQDKPQ